MNVNVPEIITLKTISAERKIKLDDHHNHSELFGNLNVYLLARWEVVV